MQLSSSAFSDGQEIPPRYSFEGGNINPPLSWSAAPEGTESFALVMDDPDIPETAGVPVWIHWIVFNIPPIVSTIAEGVSPQGKRGIGTRGGMDYGGPRPPDREHRYFFRLYALDSMLALDEGADAEALEAAMEGHVLARAELMGRYAPVRQP